MTIHCICSVQRGSRCIIKFLIHGGGKSENKQDCGFTEAEFTTLKVQRGVLSPRFGERTREIDTKESQSIS
jgi:hypothetical protein